MDKYIKALEDLKLQLDLSIIHAEQTLDALKLLDRKANEIYIALLEDKNKTNEETK